MHRPRPTPADVRAEYNAALFASTVALIAQLAREYKKRGQPEVAREFLWHVLHACEELLKPESDSLREKAT